MFFRLKYIIFKVLLNANVMSVSLPPLIAQIHALTLMNALMITTSVVIMPTAVIMKAVSHASVTMALKLVHLILSPVLTLMNVLLVLAPILVKIQLAPLHAHVLMGLLSTVTLPVVTILMNATTIPLVMSMLIAVTFQVHSSVHAKGDMTAME